MWHYNNEYIFELFHYGVKGMKWGVRNGPPYPLQSKTKRNASKNYKSSVVGGIESIIIATAALSIPVVASYVRQRNAKAKTEKLLNSMEKTDIIGLSDLPKIKGDHTIESDLVASNPKFTESTDYQMNCAHCTTTYELRRRGFDVEALPRPIGLSEKEIEALYKNAKFKELSGNDKLAEMTKEAKIWGNGARGSIGVYYGAGVGHIFSVEVQNGKVLFVDAQSGAKIKNGVFPFFNPVTKRVEQRDLSKDIVSGKFIRTDTLELTDNILKTVKKRKV